jgi:RNase P subunit RPR2
MATFLTSSEENDYLSSLIQRASDNFKTQSTLSRSIINKNDEIIAKNKILLQELRASLQRTNLAIDKLNSLYL